MQVRIPLTISKIGISHISKAGELHHNSMAGFYAPHKAAPARPSEMKLDSLITTFKIRASEKREFSTWEEKACIGHLVGEQLSITQGQ